MVLFLDPRPPVVLRQTSGARQTARSTHIGLLANGYPDSAEFLRLLGLELAARHGCTTVAVTKAAPPVPLDEAQLSVLAGCGAVIAAYGH